MNSRSCLACRKAHKRCDKRTPCTRCCQLGLDCCFPQSFKNLRIPDFGETFKNNFFVLHLSGSDVQVASVDTTSPGMCIQQRLTTHHHQGMSSPSSAASASASASESVVQQLQQQQKPPSQRALSSTLSLVESGEEEGRHSSESSPPSPSTDSQSRGWRRGGSSQSPVGDSQIVTSASSGSEEEEEEEEEEELGSRKKGTGRGIHLTAEAMDLDTEEGELAVAAQLRLMAREAGHPQHPTMLPPKWRRHSGGESPSGVLPPRLQKQPPPSSSSSTGPRRWAMEGREHTQEEGAAKMGSGQLPVVEPALLCRNSLYAVDRGHVDSLFRGFVARHQRGAKRILCPPTACKLPPLPWILSHQGEDTTVDSCTTSGGCAVTAGQAI